MTPKTKKILLICLASLAGLLLLVLLAGYIWFMAQFGLYRDKTYGFTIKYPKSWQTIIGPQPGAAVAFVHPKETALDVFEANANIAVQDVPETIATAKQLSDQAALQMTVVFGDMKKVLQKPISFGGRQGYQVVFFVAKPPPLVIVNVFMVKGAEKAYIFTFVSTAKRYRSYLPFIREMVSSFQLTR